LSRITAKTLIIGINSDVLFPKEEQKFLRNHIAGSRFQLIDSIYGHDGFLIEYQALIEQFKIFLNPIT
jgi:homoserine O-acetyltransferase